VDLDLSRVGRIHRQLDPVGKLRVLFAVPGANVMILEIISPPPQKKW
jgi:hypothetical protein